MSLLLNCFWQLTKIGFHVNVQLGSSAESVRDEPEVANKETEFFNRKTDITNIMRVFRSYSCIDKKSVLDFIVQVRLRFGLVNFFRT